MHKLLETTISLSCIAQPDVKSEKSLALFCSMTFMEEPTFWTTRNEAITPLKCTCWLLNRGTPIPVSEKRRKGKKEGREREEISTFLSAIKFYHFRTSDPCIFLLTQSFPCIVNFSISPQSFKAIFLSWVLSFKLHFL